MTTKIRRDPFGPDSMARFKSNANHLRELALVEHRADGEHNAREVPRVVRRISGTTVSPSSSDITSVANGTTGTYTLTLAGSRFDAGFMTAQINPCGSDVANKPYLTGYRVISNTSLEVYLKQLTSTLGDEGAPNTWAATNVDFDIAIHSLPLSVGSWPNALPAASLRGDPKKPTRWNALVRNAADMLKQLDVDHSTSGSHQTRQVARSSGMWRYDGSTVDLVAGVGPALSISRSSTGIYAVTSSQTLTSEVHSFVSPDYARINSGDPSKLYRMHVRQTSTTAFTVYAYAWNRTNFTWSRADGDFWLVMHSG